MYHFIFQHYYWLLPSLFKYCQRFTKQLFYSISNHFPTLLPNLLLLTSHKNYFLFLFQAFDNIKIYPVCENRACNNKELTSDTCSSCGKNQSKTKLYSRVTLTLDTGISFHTLSMFYPEYCTLCAYADLDSTLKEEVVVSNITSLLGQCIYYNIKNSSISEVTLKRASSSDD